MVNKENMRLVVAALRSGKYPQGQGRLKQIRNDSTEVKYCCMGVMCEVAIEHGVELKVTTDPLAEGFVSVNFDGSAAFLREKVLDWLGVRANGELDRDLIIGKDDTETISAAFANDELKWDFERIAESMESYYKLLEDDDEPAPQD